MEHPVFDPSGDVHRGASNTRPRAVNHPSRAMLNDMVRLGTLGVRLNLVGKALPDFRDAARKDFFGHIAELGWHVESHWLSRDLV